MTRPSTKDQRFLTCWVLVERDADADEDLWVSHCLDLDIISQGSTPQEAIEHVAEAVVIAMADDLQHDLDPLDRPKAPAEEWGKLFKILQSGTPVKASSLQHPLACRDRQRPRHQGRHDPLVVAVVLVAGVAVGDHGASTGQSRR